MYLEKSHPPLMVSPSVEKVDNENLMMREKPTLSKMFPMIWPYFSHRTFYLPTPYTENTFLV